MATVLEGRHERLGGRVALKVLDPALAAQPLAAARFLREAKAAAQVQHQHVLHVFDMGVQDGMAFLVMEFLDGEDLATHLAKGGPLPLADLVRVFLPVASAVAAAHDAGVIHRDLKPANVMLARRAPYPLHPVVLDFGISKLLDDDAEGVLTRSESLLGTVQYMAPELTRGARFASTASDQYALGVMLYECATGRRPFRGEGHYELLHAIVNAPVTPPGSLISALLPEFDEIVLRALARDPEKRFPSVRALGAALLSLGDRLSQELWHDEFNGTDGDRSASKRSTGTLRDTPITPRARAGETGGRKAWGVVVVAALMAFAVLVLVRPGRSPTPLADAQAAVPSPQPPLAAAPAPAPAAAAAAGPTEPSPATEPAVHTPSISRRSPEVARVVRSAAPAIPPSSRPLSPSVAAFADAARQAPSDKPAVVLGKNGAPILE